MSIEYKAESKIVKLEQKPRRATGGARHDDRDAAPKPDEPATRLGRGSGSARLARGGFGARARRAGGGLAARARARRRRQRRVAAEPPEMEEVEPQDARVPARRVGRQAREELRGGARAARPRQAERRGEEGLQARRARRRTLDGRRSRTAARRRSSSVARSTAAATSTSMDEQTGKAYVFSKDLLSRPRDRRVEPAPDRSARLRRQRRSESVTIDAGGKSQDRRSRHDARRAATGQQVKTWGDPETKKANQTVANFIDNANNLRPTEYASNLKVSDMTPVVKLTYKDERGATLGTLTLYKHEKPGELPTGSDARSGESAEGRDRVLHHDARRRACPALVRKDTAQRAEQDIETVFSGKARGRRSRSIRRATRSVTSRCRRRGETRSTRTALRRRCRRGQRGADGSARRARRAGDPHAGALNPHAAAPRRWRRTLRTRTRRSAAPKAPPRPKRSGSAPAAAPAAPPSRRRQPPPPAAR